MHYRDFFSRRYMLDYTSHLSWEHTYTLLWYLYNNNWRHEGSVGSDPCCYTYPLEAGNPYPTLEQTMILYLCNRQWKIL